LRLRIGSWRVVFELDTAKREIMVHALADRKDVYRA
jgi:mRNA-degrading endonuclease RelE of RelBE toxin-antitoxin system